MRGRDLAGFVLQNVGESSLQNAGSASTKAGGVIAEPLASSSSFDSDQLDLLVFDEVVEDANRVRSAAHTGNDRFRQLAFCLENLRAGLAADDAMEVAHHGGIWVCPEHAAEEIV